MKHFWGRVFLFFLLLGFGTGFLAAQNSSFWWNDAVFYEVFVRSYQDSDGDGVGDFAGLTSRLDYLNDGNPQTDDDLGVNAIWLMPITESPSYHGYDVVNYYTTDTEYGSLPEFQAFLDSAHARGIRVIMDLVINHSADDHPWFLDAEQGPASPFRDWYVWDTVHPGWAGPWGQNVWHNSSSGFYYGVFWDGMPDLNWENQAVQDEMLQVAAFWLDSVGVDGFRCDAIKHLIEDGPVQENTPATLLALKSFNDSIKVVDPEAMMIGEVWSNTSAVAPYTQNQAMDLCFEFELADAIVSDLANDQLQNLPGALANVVALYPEGQYAPFLTNHDQDRVFYRLGGNVERAKLAAGLLLTLPGVPFLYYGEEVGMLGHGPHEYIRTPMQWSSAAQAGFSTGTPWWPVNGNYAFYNVADQQNDPESLWSVYRNMVHLRMEQEALRKGKYQPGYASDSNVLLFFRQTDSLSLAVVANLSDSPVTGCTFSADSSGWQPGSWTLRELTGGFPVGTVPVQPDGSVWNWIPLDTLPPRSLRVLQIDSQVGISPPVEGRSFQVFPNPAVDWVIVRWPGGTSKNFVLTNAAGQEILTQRIHSGGKIDLSNCGTGLFFLAEKGTEQGTGGEDETRGRPILIQR